MLAGALAATIGASVGGSWAGMGWAVVAGACVAMVFGLVAVVAGANQIITGTAITLGMVGLTGTVYRQYFGPQGAGLSLETLESVRVPGLARIPLVGQALFNHRYSPTSPSWRFRSFGGCCFVPGGA